MKKLMNVTLIALSLTAVFASAAVADTLWADEYELNYANVGTLQSAPYSKAECDRQAELQNKVDLALQPLQYDVVIAEPECNHDNHRDEVAGSLVDQALASLSFDL